MKLRYEFKITCSNLMNRDPFPSLDVCFGELLHEEQRFLTQGNFKQDNSVAVAFVAQGKGKGRNMSNIQCYSCKEYGHIANNCRKKLCNYCKQQGHVIKECLTCPQNHRINAFQAVVSDNSSTTAASSTLTLEMVQQIILTAFSALGLQSNNSNSQFWLVDSAASNHMTNLSSMLKNACEYHGSSQIQVANGGHIPITKVGDIDPTFKNVFVSPKLSTSLISVGQLVDDNCDVHFSHNGCLVQDQVSGKVIAKGPKVGRLFPLHFSIPRCLLFACTTIQNKSEVRHKRLGHPNSIVLSRFLNSCLLGNKTKFSSHDVLFDCSTCKFGKSKTLPFPSHDSRAIKCFDIIYSDVWGSTPIISHAHYKYL
jgi:hypothetical protein